LIRNVLLAIFAKDCDTCGMSTQPEPELDTEVRAGLERHRGDWPRIAQSASVSHSWISQFVRGKIPNPGYATLKRLHSALDERHPTKAGT
jgi:transcriptional regulator with XRE-family HTH domain